jgi:hypothetical protein
MSRYTPRTRLSYVTATRDYHKLFGILSITKKGRDGIFGGNLSLASLFGLSNFS